ncbi:hypothetical protein COY05_03640 [Candidatus Peregrinibacteria bacterium CG_4_10_14_0_2_um_filter_38_24]|nr:MAG: hypothetical protein COY05_03640 [Candidatus Peregrinibacteria bacterium CG_4_10_14_0_2_um_filter_38_24]PJC39387.1 MAG: hypothetical protein CO044_00020 [Candidatus Peregrinibacteria bacterium CG_4_9_14_0_2_um_filter_38_9]
MKLKNCKIVVVSGNKYHISAPHGVAVGNVCINRCLEEKSIWHETAHLFGVSDHYDENTHETICGDEKCFMRWNALNGDHFCEKALSEIAF